MIVLKLKNLKKKKERAKKLTSQQGAALFSNDSKDPDAREEADNASSRGSLRKQLTGEIP